MITEEVEAVVSSNHLYSLTYFIRLGMVIAFQDGPQIDY
jgi:hypothetical protein